MLALLTLEEPNTDKEIWSTAATLYRSAALISSRSNTWTPTTNFLFVRCQICGKYLTSQTSQMLLCLPSSASIDNNGKVVPKHER